MRTIGNNGRPAPSNHKDDERRQALRALLMSPIMTPSHDSFAAVRRHADELRAWFARETGWLLHIERDCARLFKRPAKLDDDTRGLPDYERRRYVLLCLACAILERADAQITLCELAERLLSLAADPSLTTRGFTFTLSAIHERRELVAVCRSLLELGVLLRVAGDEESFIRNASATTDTGERGDVLYDVQRRVLAGLLAATRGPSTWPAEQAPIDFEDRLLALVAEHIPDSDEGQRTALRHHLTRRLLDDPVIYLDSLDGNLRAYFANQRGAIATRLCEATGLTAEQRAEGLALVDEDGELTDIAMPAEGTEAHVTLLVAEFLGQRARSGASELIDDADVIDFLREAKSRFGRRWRKSAQEPGSERELANIALLRLQQLQLIRRSTHQVHTLPALARFALGEVDIRKGGGSDTQSNLFE